MEQYSKVLPNILLTFPLSYENIHSERSLYAQNVQFLKCFKNVNISFDHSANSMGILLLNVLCTFWYKY